MYFNRYCAFQTSIWQKDMAQAGKDHVRLK